MCKIEGGAEFRIDGAMIMEYFGDGGNVVIPDGVTDIFFQVFYGNESISSVQIAGTVDGISPFLFEDCSALRRVLLCEGVREIGFCAFNRCTALEHVFLPQSIKLIREGAFDGCAPFTIHYAGDADAWKNVEWENPPDNSVILLAEYHAAI